MKRRNFLKLSSMTALASIGVLNIGCSLGNKKVALMQNANKVEKDFLWLSIQEDNTINLVVPQSEMGQGVHTSLAQILAEEMNLDFNKITVITGSGKEEYESIPVMGQGTGGSTSIKYWWEPLRQIGASCADLMLRAGAKHLGEDISKCVLKDNYIISGNKKVSFSQVANIALVMKINDKAKSKDKKDYKLVGKNIKRVDTKDKITGKAKYSLDCEFTNMAYASIFHIPKNNTTSMKIENKDELLKTPNIVDIVEMEDSVAIVANDYYTAYKNLDNIKLSLQSENKESSLKDAKDLDEKLSQFTNELEEEKASLLEDGANKVLDLEYKVPYLAHMTLEPMNATINVQSDFCEIYASSQFQSMSIKEIADITGLQKNQIKFHTTYLGAGLGRKAEVDFIRKATLISQKIKRPVKLIYSRKEDLKSDFYRPAAKSRFLINIKDDKANKMINYGISQGILKRHLPPLGWFGIAPMGGDGASEIAYNIDDFDYFHKDIDLDVKVGFWRSVGNSQNAFFIESAIDEIAHSLNKDPLEFRLSILKKENTKHARLLNEIKTFASWGNPQDGFEQGLAIHSSFDSVVATVIEVKKDKDKLTLGHCYIVADAGDYVNPHLVKQQLIGATILGLSAAIYEEVTFDKYQITNNNFTDYQILGMDMAPNFKTKLLTSEGKIGGVGEIGTPPAAPALTNAIFKAIGVRVRELPIKNILVV